MKKEELKLSKEDHKKIQEFTKKQHAEMTRILDEFTEKVRNLTKEIIKEELEKEIKNLSKEKGWLHKAVNKFKNDKKN